MGKNAKARASKKSVSFEAVERLKKAREILDEQVKQGAILDTLFEVEDAGYHVSIVLMPSDGSVKVNAYGDMNSSSWLEVLKNFGFKENGTFTDNTPDEDCPACGGTGFIHDCFN